VKVDLLYSFIGAAFLHINLQTTFATMATAPNTNASAIPITASPGQNKVGSVASVSLAARISQSYQMDGT
jgi:hypothetical protein